MTITKETIETICVSGTGSAKEQAFASALGSIQKKMMEQSMDVLLRIEPVAVELIEAIEEVETERFLFFFFPREKKTYRVSLNVSVQVTRIVTDEVPFKTALSKKSSSHQSLLKKISI